MAQGYGDPGPPSRNGEPGGWSPPRRGRRARRDEPSAPARGPASDQVGPDAGDPNPDDFPGLSSGYDPFPPQAYQRPPGRAEGRPGGTGTRDGQPANASSWTGQPRDAAPPHGRPPDPRSWFGQPADTGARAGQPGDTDSWSDRPPGPRSDHPAGPGSRPGQGDSRSDRRGGDSGSWTGQTGGADSWTGRTGDTGSWTRGGDSWSGRPVDTGSWSGQPIDTGSWSGQPIDTGSWSGQPVDSGRWDDRPRETDPYERTGDFHRPGGDQRGYAGAPRVMPPATNRPPGQMPPPGSPAVGPQYGPGPMAPADRDPRTTSRAPQPILPQRTAAPRMPPRRVPPPSSAPGSSLPVSSFPDPSPADAPADRARRRPGRSILIGILTIVLLSGAGFGAVEWNRHRKPATTAVTAPSPVALPSGDPIASQKTDPTPLTTAEVFGRPTIPSGANDSGYTVVRSEAVDCTNVALDKIATLLASLGCTQAIRATLTSSDNAYVITAGIVNLPDATAAANARTSIKSLIAAGTGRFVGLGTDGLPSAAQATTHLGWDSRGHYLTYAVIALANNKPISSTDTHTATIINDVIEAYLGATIIGARESH